ncbi:preprotein translocase subunit SecG [Candidatus Dojkabacteria bacterium]|nr:preprotein translocase subunit SecG [Candidatus Dojkabacteria bacterium]
MDTKLVLKIAQIVVAIAVVVSILLQNRGEGLGTFLGGGGEVFRTRRGLEKSLYITTVVLAILLVILSLVNTSLS